MWKEPFNIVGHTYYAILGVRYAEIYLDTRISSKLNQPISEVLL